MHICEDDKGIGLLIVGPHQHAPAEEAVMAVIVVVYEPSSGLLERVVLCLRLMTLKSRGPVPIYYEPPIWYMNLKPS